MLPRLKPLQKNKTFPSSHTKLPVPSLVYRTRTTTQPIYQNMNVIIEKTDGVGTLYLGDYFAASDKIKLREKGISTVLTVAIGLNIHYTKNIKHHVYPAYDDENYDISRYFADTFKAIEEGLRKGNVLVHCAAGVSRSASIVIAYLMKKNKWTFKIAYEFVKKKRNVIFPNSGFVKQLKMLEKKILENTEQK